MLNLEYKSESQQQQNSVIIIEGECKNIETKCNFCDNKAYWNKKVLNKRTGKLMLLDRQYSGYGDPVPHRGCKYNLENFYQRIVILESDSPYIKNKKLNMQAKLKGYDYMSQQTRYPVPVEWFSNSFNSK